MPARSARRSSASICARSTTTIRRRHPQGLARSLRRSSSATSSCRPRSFLRFAKRFGKLVEYPFIKGIEGFPEIIPVVKLEHEKTNFGGVWHSDTTYLEKPPMGTMLIAREVPAQGGDTLFANKYLAYETLSDGMKRMLDGLIAVNSSAKADASRTREDRVRDMKRDDAKKEYVGEHPVVRTHPETGRKALYRQRRPHRALQGHDRGGKRAAAANICSSTRSRPEFTCRFRWQAGSIAFWDNRCAQHNAVNDYHGYRRVMHRITLAGDKPR